MFSQYVVCVLLLGALFSATESEIVTNPNATRSWGQCKVKALEFLSSKLPTWMLPTAKQHRLPDDLTYNFLIFRKNTVLPQTRKWSVDEDLSGTFFDTRQPTLVIFPCWGDTPTNVHNSYLRKEYLKLVPKGNVLIIDTTEGLSFVNSYPHVLSNTFGASCQLATLISNLVQKRKYNIKLLHLTGFSFGGQGIGLTGAFVKKLTNGQTIARLSCQDPAGMWFNDQTNPDFFADKSDGDFVDVIYTSVGSTTVANATMAYNIPFGHVNFYPDGGRLQNICFLNEAFNDLSKICSHYASIYYFAESINGPCDYASCACPAVAKLDSTQDDWNQCLKTCNPRDGSVMGYHSIEKPGTGGPQYLKIPLTAQCSSPFALLGINEITDQISHNLNKTFNALGLTSVFWETMSSMQDFLFNVLRPIFGNLWN